jgi:hypothetical protein
MSDRYSVPLEYSAYSDSHLNFEFKGKIQIMAVAYQIVESVGKFFVDWVRIRRVHSIDQTFHHQALLELGPML